MTRNHGRVALHHDALDDLVFAACADAVNVDKAWFIFAQNQRFRDVFAGDGDMNKLAGGDGPLRDGALILAEFCLCDVAAEVLHNGYETHRVCPLRPGVEGNAQPNGDVRADVLIALGTCWIRKGVGSRQAACCDRKECSCQ
ncbi:MAG: hypothetical protein ACI9KE_006449 [Polyangiales bacterium]|jgi:hypothetical protein